MIKIGPYLFSLPERGKEQTSQVPLTYSPPHIYFKEVTYVCVCMFVSMHICLCARTLYVYACLCIYVCLYVYVYSCLCTCVHLFVCVHLCTCVYVYVCVCLCVYVLSCDTSPPCEVVTSCYTEVPLEGREVFI